MCGTREFVQRFMRLHATFLYCFAKYLHALDLSIEDKLMMDIIWKMRTQGTHLYFIKQPNYVTF